MEPQKLSPPPLTTSPAEPVRDTLADVHVTPWLPVAADLGGLLGSLAPTAQELAVIYYLASGDYGFDWGHLLARGQVAAQFLAATGWVYVIDRQGFDADQVLVVTTEASSYGNKYPNALAQARAWLAEGRPFSDVGQALAERYKYADPLYLYAVLTLAHSDPSAAPSDTDPATVHALTTGLLRIYTEGTKPRPQHFASGGTRREVVVFGQVGGPPLVAVQDDDDDGGAGDDFDPNDTGLHPGDTTAEDFADRC